MAGQIARVFGEPSQCGRIGQLGGGLTNPASMGALEYRRQAAARLLTSQ
jgi:hypothetical protein